MNHDLADIAAAHRAVVAAAILERDWWQRERVRHQEEATRWWARVDLAERHQEFDLATAAAQRARQHAGQAVAAEAHLQAHRALVAQLRDGVPAPGNRGPVPVLG